MNIKWWQHHKMMIGWSVLGAGTLALSIFFELTNWQQQPFWSTFKELIVLVGGIVAVITYFRNGSTRRQDIAFRKFDKTIEAEQYFHGEIVKSIEQAIDQYTRDLKARDYNEIQNKAIKLSVIRSIVMQSGFSKCFKQLNVLAAYPYYETVNQLQLYSSIADDIKRLTEVPEFMTVEAIFNEQYQMNNYKMIIDNALDYLIQVEKRRHFDEKV